MDILMLVKLINGEDIVGQIVNVTVESVTLKDIYRVFYMQDGQGEVKYTMGQWIPSDDIGDMHTINQHQCIVTAPCKGAMMDLYFYFLTKNIMIKGASEHRKSEMTSGGLIVPTHESSNTVH